MIARGRGEKKKKKKVGEAKRVFNHLLESMMRVIAFPPLFLSFSRSKTTFPQVTSVLNNRIANHRYVIEGIAS